MEERDDMIYLTSKVNELFAITELTQYFTNELKKSIELTILFPIIEEISLSKFIVSIDDKIVISKVMPKEKAKEKYNDSIASGNVVFYSSYEENQNSYSVNIGNIKPKQKIKLNTIFIQMIGTNDMNLLSYDRDETLNNIREIIKGIKENRPYASIYVQSIYPINKTTDSKVSLPTVGIRENEEIQKVNEEIKKIAKKEKVQYIDMYQELADENGNFNIYYTKDGLHLNELGYYMVTKKLETILE